MSTALKTETRSLKMHAQLLYDVIMRQAGTLAKAVLEGVMNSVDAKATKCQIDVTPQLITISDDGQGFRSREEIEKWFEMFGEPHTEAENKYYASFRMGRGQLFSFGRNVWKSGKFEMSIDIKNKGLDYELSTMRKNHPGCFITIELYEGLTHSGQLELEDSLKLWCKYTPIKIELNGKTISHKPEADEDWDEINDEAFIRYKNTGVLHVYNRGIWVMDVGAYKYGTGGVVVSKEKVQVNFARNDIMSTCPVWKKIVNTLEAYSGKEVVKNKTLSVDERRKLVRSFITGGVSAEQIWSKPLIRAVTGRYCSLSNVTSLGSISMEAEGHHLGDKIHRNKMAFVMASEQLEWFNCDTLQEFYEKIQDRLTQSRWLRERWKAVKVVPFSQLRQALDEKYLIIPPERYNWREKMWLETLNSAVYYLTGQNEEGAYAHSRRVLLGIGPADGWTDGSSYIAIDQEYLQQRGYTIESILKVGYLLLHEMCHTSPSVGRHDHDQEFYEQFHDQIDKVAAFSRKTLLGLKSRLGSKGLAKKIARELDRLDEIVQREQKVLTKVNEIVTAAQVAAR